MDFLCWYIFLYFCSFTRVDLHDRVTSQVSLAKGARAFKHSTKPGMSSKPWVSFLALHSSNQSRNLFGVCAFVDNEIRSCDCRNFSTCAFRAWEATSSHFKCWLFWTYCDSFCLPCMSQQETSFVPEQPDALMKADYQMRWSGNPKRGGAGNSSREHLTRENMAALRGAASFKENAAQQQKKRQQPVIMMYE